MKTTQNTLQSRNEENTVVSPGSGPDPRGSHRNLSSPCERAETSVSDSVELLNALKEISSLWPKPGQCPPINPEWVGERDGKMRAILLEAAIEIARKAIAKAEDGGAR